MDEIRLIDANALKEKLLNSFGCVYGRRCGKTFTKEMIDKVFQIIDKTPTINPERTYVIDSCDMNVFEPEKYVRPEKKLQTPSCLTNPERQAELLERYKEE